REAESQAALDAIRAVLALHEELEDAPDLLGRDALPVVGHPQDGAAVLGADLDRDRLARGAEFDGVIEEIGKDLLDARPVGLDENRHAGPREPDRIGARRPQTAQHILYEFRKIEDAALERRLAHRDAADVEQVLDQARHLARLALEHRARLVGRWARGRD